MKPIAIDLFCGAGGMSEGIIQAGFHIVFSSDMNEQVQKTYMNRHEKLGLKHGENTYFERADIRELNGDFIRDKISQLKLYEKKQLPAIDAIFGGPPCQGFSRAGKRNRNDPRNMLFREYLRVVNEVRPKYVIMENVMGMLDTKLDGFVGVNGDAYEDDSLVTDLLHQEFDKIGYDHLMPKVLDASDYGVPQRRKRVIYIAFLKGFAVPAYPEPTTPLRKDKITVGEAIGDLMFSESSNKYQEHISTKYQLDSQYGRTLKSDEKSEILNHEKTKHDLHIHERFSLFNEGESQKNLKNRLSNGFDIRKYPNLLKFTASKLKSSLTEKQIVDICSNHGVDEKVLEAVLTRKNSRMRLNSQDLAPTMLSSSDDFISPIEARGLTVREMARIQSFDDSFEFLGKRTTGGLKRRVEVPQMTQVGNAVPPLLAKAIALEIKKLV